MSVRINTRIESTFFGGLLQRFVVNEVQTSAKNEVVVRIALKIGRQYQLVQVWSDLSVGQRFTRETDAIEKRALGCDRFQSQTLVSEGLRQVVDRLCGCFADISRVVFGKSQWFSCFDATGFQSIQFIDNYLIDI